MATIWRWMGNTQIECSPKYIQYTDLLAITFRSSRKEVFCKKGVLRNFAKFTGKHLCQSLFFNNVAGLRCFPVNFTKSLRTPFLTGHLRWLLLYFMHWFIRVTVFLFTFYFFYILLHRDSQIFPMLFKEVSFKKTTRSFLIWQKKWKIKWKNKTHYTIILLSRGSSIIYLLQKPIHFN